VQWSERMDITGTNHWLPAYGFQQPTQLQQAIIQHQDVNGMFVKLIKVHLGSSFVSGRNVYVDLVCSRT
jgi:hypothetical protein